MESERTEPGCAARAFIGASSACMLPAVLALCGALALGAFEVYAYGEIPARGGMERLTPVWAMFIAFAVGMFGAAVLAVGGLVFHALGLGLAIKARRLGVRVLGPLLIACHGGMLILDVLYLGTLIFIAATFN